MKIDRSIRIASADNEKVWLDIKVQGDSIEFRTKGGSPVVLSDEDDVRAVIDALTEASSKAEHARRLNRDEDYTRGMEGRIFRGGYINAIPPHLRDGLVGVNLHRVTDEGNVVMAPQIIAAAGEGGYYPSEVELPEATTRVIPEAVYEDADSEILAYEGEAVIQKSAGDYEPLPEAAEVERVSEPKRGQGGRFTKKGV